MNPMETYWLGMKEKNTTKKTLRPVGYSHSGKLPPISWKMEMSQLLKWTPLAPLAKTISSQWATASMEPTDFHQNNK